MTSRLSRSRHIALRLSGLLMLALSFSNVGSAQAQLYWKPADLSGPPITGVEPDVGVNLPQRHAC